MSENVKKENDWQEYRSQYNSSFGYAEDLRYLFQDAAFLRREISLGKIDLVPALVGDLGSAVPLVRMLTTNPEKKERILSDFQELKKKMLAEFTAIRNGKELFNMDLIDECEKFQDSLMQQVQYAGAGFSLEKKFSKMKKLEAAMGKGELSD